MQTSNFLLSTVYFAQAYGEGEYGRELYSQTTTSTEQPTSDGDSSNQTLADTGTSLILAVSVAALIIFVVLLTRVWKRPAEDKQ